MIGESSFGSIGLKDSSRMMTPGKLAQFDDYELDFGSRELRRRGVAVAIPPQPLLLLMLLVSSGGQMVERGSLQAQLWGDHPSSDVESSLNHLVRKLRDILRDDARDPSHVETVHRRGYRLMHSVRWLGGDGGSPISAKARLSGRHRVDQEVSDGGLVYLKRWWRDEQRCEPLVLQISELTDSCDDRAWPPIAEGVREDLIMLLIKLPDELGLRVIDGSRVGGRSDIVPWHVELCGSLCRAGQRVRARIRLISGEDAAVVGGLTFELDVTNVFSLQQEIAGSIVEYLVRPLLGLMTDQVADSLSSKDF